MHEVERLISQFRREDTDSLADSDTSVKPGIIQALEDYASDSRVFDFLLQVVADRTEFDLARIEALKVLEIRQAQNDQERRQISTVLKDILSGDTDDDVRNYAAMAAASYMTENALFEEVVKVLFNEDSDTDLRWNAFTAIEKMGPTPRSIESMRTASQHPGFQNSANRLLRSWDVQ